MTLEEHLQLAVAELTSRIRDSLAGELHELIRAAAEHARAEEENSLREARRAWEAERAEFVARELARALEDAEHRLAAAIATVRAQADQALIAAKADTDRALAAAKAEQDRAIAGAVAAAKSEAEETLTAQLAIAGAEADERLSREVSRLREEARRDLDLALFAARQTTELQLAEQVGSVRAEADRRISEQVAAVRAESERRTAEEIASVRGEAERRLADEMASVRAEADRRISEQVGAVRAESERRAAEEIASVRSESERRLADELANARAESERRLADEVASVRAEAERRAADQIASVKSESERRLAEQVATVHAAAERTLEDELREVTGERVSERQASIEGFTRLVNAVRRLDAAPSLSDVLDSLGERAALEAGRIAVFIVQGRRVRGWRIAGFEPDLVDARAIDLSLEEAGIIGQAASKAETCSVHAGPSGAPAGTEPSFVRLPPHRNACAVPVRVGGQIMAVVYADDDGAAGQQVAPSWAEAIEVLVRHAGLCLESLTAARAAQMAAMPRVKAAGAAAPAPIVAAPPSSFAQPGADRAAEGETEDAARRYARLLLSEIKLYNEAAVKQGRQERDLFERLRPQIERARTLYEEKIPPSVRSRALYFDQELVRTLADGDPNLLGN